MNLKKTIGTKKSNKEENVKGKKSYRLRKQLEEEQQKEMKEYTGFGLAFPKKEGGKLHPIDYFFLNHCFATKDMYTEEERNAFVKDGLDEKEWYANKPIQD